MAMSHQDRRCLNLPVREKPAQRGAGEKFRPLHARVKGRKQLLDLLEEYRRKFFHYQEQVEDDKHRQHERRRRGDKDWAWPGGRVLLAAKSQGARWRIGCWMYLWHYEGMTGYRAKYLALYWELETRGIVPPFPFDL